MVSQLKIDGVKSITFTDDFTNNQRILYSSNFPDDLVPEKYVSQIGCQVMDDPCVDKDVPDQTQVLDPSDIKDGKNPYNRQPLPKANLRPLMALKGEIRRFTRKVEIVFQTFPETYNQKYLQYQAPILDPSVTPEAFRAMLQPHAAQAASSQEAPLSLYKAAIENYKRRDFDAAIVKLRQSMLQFERLQADSTECMNCLSTLVSCHREVGEYATAREYAERAITIFYGKTGVDAIVAKYHQCLQLSGDTPNKVYDSAVAAYRAGQHAVATCQVLYAVEAFGPNAKNELAYCHSLLASCYREMGLYDDAITHAQQALVIRQGLGDAALIRHAEEKLDALLMLVLPGPSFSF